MSSLVLQCWAEQEGELVFECERVPLPVRHRLYVQCLTRKRARVRWSGEAEEEERGEEGSANKVKVGIHLHTMLRVGCWVTQGLREEDKKEEENIKQGGRECRRAVSR